MKKKLCILLSIVFAVLFLDQFSKIWIDHHLLEGQHLTVVSHYFDLVHYRNPGAAFGMFAAWASPWREVFFYVVSSAALIFLLIYFIKTSDSHKSILIALAMILGGALGNLIDRIFRGNVVDFILWYWNDKIVHFSLLGKHYTMALVWPAFNIADAAISVGVALLIFSTLKTRE